MCGAVPTKQVLEKAGGGGSDGQRCHLRAGPGGPAACAAGRALASAGAELGGSMAQAQERRLGLWCWEGERTTLAERHSKSFPR